MSRDNSQSINDSFQEEKIQQKQQEKSKIAFDTSELSIFVSQQQNQKKNSNKNNDSIKGLNSRSKFQNKMKNNKCQQGGHMESNDDENEGESSKFSHTNTSKNNNSLHSNDTFQDNSSSMQGLANTSQNSGSHSLKMNQDFMKYEQVNQFINCFEESGGNLSSSNQNNQINSKSIINKDLLDIVGMVGHQVQEVKDKVSQKLNIDESQNKNIIKNDRQINNVRVNQNIKQIKKQSSNSNTATNNNNSNINSGDQKQNSTDSEQNQDLSLNSKDQVSKVLIQKNQDENVKDFKLQNDLKLDKKQKNTEDNNSQQQKQKNSDFMKNIPFISNSDFKDIIQIKSQQQQKQQMKQSQQNKEEVKEIEENLENLQIEKQNITDDKNNNFNDNQILVKSKSKESDIKNNNLIEEESDKDCQLLEVFQQKPKDTFNSNNLRPLIYNSASDPNNLLQKINSKSLTPNGQFNNNGIFNQQQQLQEQWNMQRLYQQFQQQENLSTPRQNYDMDYLNSQNSQTSSVNKLSTPYNQNTDMSNLSSAQASTQKIQHVQMMQTKNSSNLSTGITDISEVQDSEATNYTNNKSSSSFGNSQKVDFTNNKFQNISIQQQQHNIGMVNTGPTFFYSNSNSNMTQLQQQFQQQSQQLPLNTQQSPTQQLNQLQNHQQYNGVQQIQEQWQMNFNQQQAQIAMQQNMQQNNIPQQFDDQMTNQQKRQNQRQANYRKTTKKNNLNMNNQSFSIQQTQSVSYNYPQNNQFQQQLQQQGQGQGQIQQNLTFIPQFQQKNSNSSIQQQRNSNSQQYFSESNNSFHNPPIQKNKQNFQGQQFLDMPKNYQNSNQLTQMSDSNSDVVSQCSYQNYSNKGGGRKNQPMSSDESQQFEINLENIRNYKDQRTTIMIRNIPNKYTHKMLVEAIDQYCKGQYDFFYLPQDHKNDCGMGYAFINFIKIDFIPNLYHNFENKTWPKFKSDKVCQIKYARIQGYENLSKHFEFTSVMNSKDIRIKPQFNCGQGNNRHHNDQAKNKINNKINQLIEKQRKQTRQ